MRVYDWARAHLVIGGVDFGMSREVSKLVRALEHFYKVANARTPADRAALERARVKRARKNARRLAEMRLVLVEARGGVPPLLVEDIAAAEAAISRAVLGNLDPNTVAPARSLAVPWWGR